MAKTEKEREEERLAAEAFAATIGGLLALLLGLRRDPLVTVRFDPTTATFVVNGKPLPVEVIRDEMTRIEARFASKINKVSNDLALGKISIPEWEEEMRKIVASSHILYAALASGSTSAAVTTPIVYFRIESEMKFLDGMVRQLKLFADDTPQSSTPTSSKRLSFDSDLKSSKPIDPYKPKFHGHRINGRAVSYLFAATATYAVVEYRLKKELGYSEAIRVRTAAESCEGCLRFAGKWMPIEEMPVIGSLDCGSKCRCFLKYR